MQSGNAARGYKLAKCKQVGSADPKCESLSPEFGALKCLTAEITVTPSNDSETNRGREEKDGRRGRDNEFSRSGLSVGPRRPRQIWTAFEFKPVVRGSVPNDHSLAPCLFHERLLIKIHNPQSASSDQKPPAKRANRLSPRRRDRDVSGGRVGGGRAALGHGRSFCVKMILERRDKIFTREKYEEIAHRLERAGFPLRGAGRGEDRRGGGGGGGLGRRLGRNWERWKARGERKNKI